MLKPINVEAQRVAKFIGETKQRLLILSLLNEKFFDQIREDIRKSESATQNIMNRFDRQIGKLLINHAFLEEKFNTECVEEGMNGMKMIGLEEDHLGEEGRDTIFKLKDTINKLIRAFSDPIKFQKLKEISQISPEFETFKGSIDKLQELYGFKLGTPLEEVKANEATLKFLTIKTEKLKQLKQTRQDAYDKYVEECQKSKDQREITIKSLKELVNSEKATQNNLEDQIKEQGTNDLEIIQQQHEDTMKSLQTLIDKLTKEKNKLRDNKKAEKDLRKDFKLKSQDLVNTIGTYDQEVNSQSLENAKARNDLEDTMLDLQQIKEVYNMKVEEKRKRDLMDEMMQKKKDEQNEKMYRLEKATQYVQAHWRGFIAKKESFKFRSKKKKKKKK